MQWILAHFLFLLPLSIITYRAITSANIEKIFLIIFIIFLVWSIFRIFHATRILMSLPFNQTFLVLAISMILITGTFGMFLQRTRAFWDYFEYFVHMLI
jgi:hypothetical protein